MCSPNGTPSRVAVYLYAITLSLVENVDFFFVCEEHLLRGVRNGE